MKKLTNKQIEQVRQALALFANQGALARLRVQSSSAFQWDSLIAHHVTVFTGIEVVPGTVRHWRSEAGCKWYAEGDDVVDMELFAPKAKQALLLVSSEDLGKLVDQAVEQALNTREPESTVEPQDIETPETEPQDAVELASAMVA